MEMEARSSETLSDPGTGKRDGRGRQWSPAFHARRRVRQLVDGKAEAYPLPGIRRLFRPIRLLRDRDGGLWIATTDQGLLHVHQGRTDQFARSDGLSDDFVQGLFEDREGNLWVVTVDGLDRFRDFAIPSLSIKQGLSNASVSSVLAARDGSVWLGTDDGLNMWKDGQITIYRKRNSGLPDDSVEAAFEDDRGRIWVATRGGVAWFENGRFTPAGDVPPGQIHSIAGDRPGNLWINHDHGLLHLLGGSGRPDPWARLGRTDGLRALLLDPDARWAMAWICVVVLPFSRMARSANPIQLRWIREGRVTDLHLDRDGTLWAATEGGLSRLKNGRIATLDEQERIALRQRSLGAGR